MKKMTNMIKNFLNDKELNERIKYSQNNRYREFYSNGYGISIIPDISDSTLFEICVLKGNENEYELCFDTPITDDVIEGLTLLQAHEIAKQISELEPGAEKLN